MAIASSPPYTLLMTASSVEPPLLGHPTRARVLSGLAARNRPTRVEDLAEDLALDADAVRLHLQQLEEARFVRRQAGAHNGPGRPLEEWSAAGGELPVRSAYKALSKWLSGVLDSNLSPLEIRDTGRSIGRDMAAGREPEDAIKELDGLLTALGFSPSYDGEGRFQLQACPFRAAAEENPTLVCSLHHGIVEGFTAAIDPELRILLFEPRPPAEAGCLIDVTRLRR